jgi:hypothetical protein
MRCNRTRQNITAAWLAFLLHIQEVLGTNLGPGTCYPVLTEAFLVFFSPLTQISGQYLKLLQNYFFPHPFFINHYSPVISSNTTHSEVLKALLNKSINNKIHKHKTKTQANAPWGRACNANKV